MTDITPLLTRIADALDRLSPAPFAWPQADSASSRSSAWVWDGARQSVAGVPTPRRVPLDLILGADSQKARLLANTFRFARGHPANHAMLWGSRGTGKSALVKAVHAQIAQTNPHVKLIEVARGDIATVPVLAQKLSDAGWQAILFIDDLSFERGDESYKALKTVLDGGLSGAMTNLLVYVTSNRRHLVNRPDGTQADFRPDETVEEQIALSERFGLWLGFHPMDQATWLSIVRSYCTVLKLEPTDTSLDITALQWAGGRGSRTGRSAWQFIVERAGDMGKPITFEAL